MLSLQLTAPRSLDLVDTPALPAPGAGQALVRVHSVGICGTDFSGYLGKMPFIQYPRILGHELGVEILAIGPDVTHLQLGEKCCVEPYQNCGQCKGCRTGHTNRCERLEVLGVHCDGGMTEQLLLPVQKLHAASDLTYEQLALVEMLGIGCHAVNRAAVTAGERVLVLGAGPIGLTVITFALLAGAQVFVHELHSARRSFVAQHYPTAQLCTALPEECSADAVFDATGHPDSMAAALRYAAFGARVVYVGITSQPVVLDDPLFHRRELTLLASRNSVPTDFQRILTLLRSGAISTQHWITHRAHGLAELPSSMEQWLQPEAGVVKAVLNL